MHPELFHFIYDSPDNPWCGGGGAQRDFEILKHLNAEWTTSVFSGIHPRAGTFATPCLRRNLGIAALGELCSRWSYAWHAGRIARKVLKQGKVVISHGASCFAPVLPLSASHPAIVHSVYHLVDRASLLRRIGPLGLIGWRLQQNVIKNGLWFLTINRETSRRIIEQNPNARIFVIPTGFHPPAETPIPFGTQDKPYIIFLGRLDHHMKGLDRLLAAFSEVATVFPTLELRLAGRSDAATNAWFERELAQHPHAARIHIHQNPSEAEKYSLLAGARFFCSPSRFEGWCIAAIEASSQGLPVVATRTDGFLDSAPDGYTSILVDNEADCIPELAQAFRRLLTEPDLRARLGANGREWASRFDWPSTARMQGDLYRQVLDCLNGAPLPPPGIVNTMESFRPKP
ncbi:MAG: hypothetical protein RL318_1598 [Fibrobacterota bacterium]|jgi:glycosyltransferase involved in cell wall biosynthesis